MLSDKGFRSGVQGTSPTASRLSCGSAIILLIQWPNAVPTGITPKRVALLKILRPRNSFNQPMRFRTGPSSRALAGSRCLVDLVSVVEVFMLIFTPLSSIFLCHTVVRCNKLAKPRQLLAVSRYLRLMFVWLGISLCAGDDIPPKGEIWSLVIIRPAALRVGFKKRIGWHTFRHTFSTAAY